MVIATRYLNPGEIQELETAIASVEQETSAEIVCAVATESGRYDRPEAMVGILFAIISLLLFNLAAPYGGTKVETPDAGRERGGVAVGWTDVEAINVSVQVLALVLGFVVGNLVGSYCAPLRRLLTRRRCMESEVARSAAFVFAQQRIASTREAGGLLLFVSLYERRFVVLADVGVVAATGQEFLDGLRDQGVAALRSGKPDQALIEAVKAAGQVLKDKLPGESSSKDDDNELSNHVIMIHPRP